MSDSRWEYDVGRLGDTLGEMLGISRRRSRLLLAGLGLALLGVAAGVW